MDPKDKYYAREALELTKPAMLFNHFGGEWEKRKLPWPLYVWPFRKFIRQWTLVSPKKTLTPATGRTITFRRYHEKEKNSKHD